MADLTLTVAQVSPVNDVEYEAPTYLAAAALTLGTPVYVNSSGNVAAAQGNAVGTSRCVGIVIAQQGLATTVLQRGRLAGFDLSGMAYGANAYLSSATAAKLQDAIVTGTGNVVTPVGVVVPMSDADLTKVLWVDIDLLRVPTAL